MGGRVQGVGYRAFVFNLAQRSGLSGVVQNLTGEVLVEAQGEAGAAGCIRCRAGFRCTAAGATACRFLPADSAARGEQF